MFTYNHVKVNFNCNHTKVTPQCLEKVNEITVNLEEIGKPVLQYDVQLTQDSFQEAVKFPILFVGRWLCLIPFPENKFYWMSFRVLIVLIVMCWQIGMAILSLIWLNRSRISIYKTGSILFYSGAVIIMIFMIRLAQIWPTLTNKWIEIEHVFGHQENLRKTFLTISILVTILYLVENLCILFVDMWLFAKLPYTTEPPMKIYSEKMFPQVFGSLQYTFWRAVLVLYFNAVSKLTYSFGDQLIITLSLAMGNYFRMYNKMMRARVEKLLPEHEWKIWRLKYTKLCELTHIVDDCLCHLLCFTFLIYLYLICVEMHEGTLYESNHPNNIHKILCFFFSIIQNCTKCYTTVRVHEHSRTILEVLYALPPSSYCKEVEIFIQQILQNETVLTGSHLFPMKRSFLLTIGGTIISYQILLLQMRDFLPHDVLGTSK